LGEGGTAEEVMEGAAGEKETKGELGAERNEK